MTKISLCLSSLALVTMLAACDKGHDGAATTGESTTTGAAAKKAKTSLQLADIKRTYAAEFDAPGKMTLPMDKKVEAFAGKVGKPAADTGRKKTWYALDGDKCAKVELDTKDGSISDGTTDKADCGM